MILFVYYYVVYLSFFFFFFFLMIRRPPRSTLFPTRRSSDLAQADIAPLRDPGRGSQLMRAERGSDQAKDKGDCERREYADPDGAPVHRPVLWSVDVKIDSTNHGHLARRFRCERHTCVLLLVVTGGAHTACQTVT